MKVIVRSTPGQHGGTVIGTVWGRRGARLNHPEIVCSCGGRFPGSYHPVERDMVESPSWERHVKGTRQ